MYEDRIIIDDKTKKKYQVTFSEILETNNKIAFVIGHHENQTGFKSEFLGSEWVFWKSYAMTHLSKMGDIFFHDKNINSYEERQKQMAVVTEQYDLVFELHFNSYNETASGSHAMYYAQSEIGKELANLFTKLMFEKLEIEKDWNVPVDSTNVRGGGFIMHQKPTSLLLEAFFADNEKDVDKFLDKKEIFSEVIKELISIYYKRTNEMGTS